MVNMELDKAISTLSKNDKILCRIIKNTAKCNLKPTRTYYRSLLNAIIGQQLSMHSARAIAKRFYSHFEDKPSPSDILAESHEKMRELGLSNAKVRYVKDLAEKIENKQVKLTELKNKSNMEIITELTQVKGIGLWSAHMFLMFTLARLDILPVGDLGIKKAIMLNYGLKKLPDEKKITNIARKNKWNPYESVASWYLWKSLEQ
jgi:DNA-3-methyladenine glycosylase II